MTVSIAVLAPAMLVALFATAPTATARPLGSSTTATARSERHAWVRRGLRRRARSRRTPTAAAVAAWCDQLGRDLRAGATLRTALQCGEPTDPATRDATAGLRTAIARGRPTDVAVRCVGIDEGPHLELARRVLSTAARHGGPASMAIDGAAAVLRQRVRDEEERATHSAQARLSAHVLTAIPLFVLALLLCVDDDVRRAITSPVGAGCVAVGGLLNAAGWCWMRRAVGARS